MLGLSQGELCRLSGVGRNLLNDFEAGTRVPRSGNLDKLRSELERAGAEFLALTDGTVAVRIRPARESKFQTS
ncbi:XRE family transcriptional regulator [Fulvimarina endophytica]|uniref:XRE family transcriptional regulator n=2 Tax=Fulvimarina endophytica TaxID=2293836 RepID=A0A371X1N5_9HYPH|nr:XRE family transcriptional regulator [Fulvimarina endophytica]